MNKALTMIVVSLLCVSVFSVLTPKVMGWASNFAPLSLDLHERMALDALSDTGWSLSDSQVIADYAGKPDDLILEPGEVDLFDGHGVAMHRVTYYQRNLESYSGEEEKPGLGAEFMASSFIVTARDFYAAGQIAEARLDLACAIHFIQDAVCPPHVFPFSEDWISWAPLSWQLGSLETPPGFNFELETAEEYAHAQEFSDKNWPSIVRTAETTHIANIADLKTKIIEAANRVNTLPCSYVRQNDQLLADSDDIIGNPSHITGWDMSDENIGKCMVEAAKLVKGAAIYVRGGRSGGPDSFGYTFMDSNTHGGPTYDWIEISGSGTEVLPSSDDSWVGNIGLGFFFNYYGTDYSQLAIGNNGLLFSGVGTWQYINQPITQTPSIHGLIAPYWDDIVTWGSAGTIYYQTLGTAPNRKFVVEWYDNQHYYSSSSGITFEAILYEGTNNMLFQYKDVTFGSVSGAVGGDNPPYDYGGSATVGIEDPTGNIGLQYSFNEQVITPNLAILFKFPAFAGTNMYLSMNAPASMDHGNTMTYTLYYNDFGDVAAQNVVLHGTLSPNVDFVSASDGGTYDPATRSVTWNIGTVPAFPSGRGSRTITVTIPSSIPVGTVIQTTVSVSTSTLETRYDDNSASAQTTVTGSNLPPNVSVGPTLGNLGGTPSVYWTTPITFTYQDPTAIGVDIRIHLDDGEPDITGSMTGGPPEWTYTTTFYPRYGHATVTYTVNDPTPYSADFDLRNMRGFENTITATEIENHIRSVTPTSPMLTEAGIGQRFIDAGRSNNVNPAFLVATAQHEGVFGTQGWAAAHPDAHNTMGWGIYPGHMDEDWEGLDRNAFASWGDGIAHVAWRISAPDSPYYGAGWHTVGEIRTVYAGEPAIQTIVNYMNDLARSAGQAGVFDENFNIYVDPAGYIYDVDTLERISGASVWLQCPDGEGGWENVPTGQTPPIMQPDVNPQVTGADGQYQWDVLEGSYRVHVEAPGYYPADSIVVSVPPPVTDLHVGLTPLPRATIQSCDTLENESNLFGPAETIYACGINYQMEESVTIYVVPKGASYTSGESIYSIPAQADTSGHLHAVALGTFAPGKYDIWVDRNGNGERDEALEPVDTFGAIEGFFVIPEYWLGTILGLIGCFGALGVFRLTKRRPKLNL